MTAGVEHILQEAQRLSPAEQSELIQALSLSLLHQYRQPEPTAIPSVVRRTAPVSDLAHLIADFWPEDETADAINEYIARQRREDRMHDLC